MTSPEFETQAQMDTKMSATVRQMMESQAYRELAAAQMFGHGLKFVPSIKWQKFMVWHIREEFEHYEAVAKMYREFTGESVEPVTNERLSRHPIPFAETWFELAMAQFLYDRGGFWQLKEYERCAFVPYRRCIEKIISEEKGHQALGERIVVELCRSEKFEDRKQKDFATWLRQGLLSFGRPGSPGNAYAISVGLKKRDSGEVMQDFLNDIKPAVKASKLRFPTPQEMKLDVPESLDWSLDRVDESKAEGYRTREEDAVHIPAKD
jgi:1,2-phenylacetyl-CoA epoxidase catalytic subunit